MKLDDKDTAGLPEFIAATVALLHHHTSGSMPPILQARVERVRAAYADLTSKVRNAPKQ